MPGDTECEQKASVLVGDDQRDVLEALRILLRSAGFKPLLADSPAAVLALIEREDPDVALLDLNYTRDTTSGREGLDLLAQVKLVDPTLPVVVMTAWGSVEGAVEAMRRGARDYIQKPWDNTRVLATVRTQIELGRALRASRKLDGTVARLRLAGIPELVAESPAMAAVRRLIEQVAPADAPVLITGEHGTGKEIVARTLHALSARRERPLIAVNASGLADGVFESEFFGHVRGAFTDAKTDRLGCLELADQGTLFLDEIGDMPKGQQSKLLRALQTGEYQAVGSSKLRHADVRLLTATNADLRAAVREGRFREDLLYRINAVEIRVPPLRDRPHDVPVLARSFLGEKATKYGRHISELSPLALRALVEHPWPGNVRELEHVIERAVLLAQGDTVEPHDLMLVTGGDPSQLALMTLEQAECFLIRKALERSRGNVSDAARALGVSRSALYRRLQEYRIKVDE